MERLVPFFDFVWFLPHVFLRGRRGYLFNVPGSTQNDAYIIVPVMYLVKSMGISNSKETTLACCGCSEKISSDKTGSEPVKRRSGILLGARRRD